MPFTDGSVTKLGSLPLDGFVEAETGTAELPKAARQAVNQLLVVPDYWIGNSFHEFQARKKSVITAFVERKLRLDQPALSDVGDFYSYAVVQDPNRRQLLYSAYLQEAVAYRLYRRLESLGINPRRIATPAMIWQAKLGEQIKGFAGQGTGFVHLAESDCFLYFYFRGQFLFSRHIQLPETGGDASQTYDLLNYEINQSFYLYSQKTKSSVDALYLLAPDSSAAQRLTDLLGRPVQEMAFSLPSTDLTDETGEFRSSRCFSILDLKRHTHPAISYQPLQKELIWRPVQWAGMAVGLLLVVLLAVESGYLHVRSGAVEQQMVQLRSSATEPPDLALGELSQILDEITGALARPSGSKTVMGTLLALPPAVSLRKISLDASAARTLTIDAIIDADHPDAFKATLDVFLDRINDRFNLEQRPLREKDVTIQLERREGDARKPLYLIQFGFEIT